MPQLDPAIVRERAARLRAAGAAALAAELRARIGSESDVLIEGPGTRPRRLLRRRPLRRRGRDRVGPAHAVCRGRRAQHLIGVPVMRFWRRNVPDEPAPDADTIAPAARRRTTPSRRQPSRGGGRRTGRAADLVRPADGRAGRAEPASPEPREQPAPRRQRRAPERRRLARPAARRAVAQLGAAQRGHQHDLRAPPARRRGARRAGRAADRQRHGDRRRRRGRRGACAAPASTRRSRPRRSAPRWPRR